MSLFGLGVSLLGAGAGSLVGSAIAGKPLTPVKRENTYSGIQPGHYQSALGALNSVIQYNPAVSPVNLYKDPRTGEVMSAERSQRYAGYAGNASNDFFRSYYFDENGNINNTYNTNKGLASRTFEFAGQTEGTPAGFSGAAPMILDEAYGKAFDLLSNADNSAFEAYSKGGLEAYNEALRLQGLGPQGGGQTGLEENFLNTPGSQFEMEQARRAIDASASARGVLGSGRQAKELAKYQQGLAAQQFGARQNQLLALAAQGFQGTEKMTDLAATKAGLEVQKGQSLLDAFIGKTNSMVDLEKQFQQTASESFTTYEKR